MRERDTDVDALRTAVTLLVVLHHSILAYARFGHFDRVHYLWSTAPVVDGDRFAGFDLLVLFNDGWFMAAMFAIAGLFVTQGLRRYGPAGYLRRRALRLGLPFAFAALVLMPVAYYPSALLAGMSDDFWTFWARTVWIGPWSAGPAWFLWVLLVFDAAAAGLAVFVRVTTPVPPRRLVGLGGLIAALSMAGSVALFGPDRWFSAGPFAVQASRILLYATAFAIGVLAGPRLIGWRVRARPFACTVLFALLIGLNLVRPRAPMLLWRLSYGLTYAGFCLSAGLSALALARRCPEGAVSALQRIGPDAFWIYLVHYVPMVWLQYWLLGVSLPGLLKGSCVFVVTLGISWMLAAVIRFALGRLTAQRMPSTSIMS